MIRILPWMLVLLLAPMRPACPQEPPEDHPDKLHKRTSEKQAEMTHVRGLAFTSEVKTGIYTKEELLDFLKTEIDREMPREKLEQYQKAYAHFGLLPKKFDLYEAYIELFGAAIAGFYHPRTKELRLIRPGEGGGNALEKLGEKLFEEQFGVTMEDITLVHELCHAAQDQNFELTTLPMEDETNDDLVSALKGMVEGDASIVGWKYAFKDQFDLLIGPTNTQYKTGAIPGKAGRLPAFLRKMLTFPYGYGTEFVLDVWRHSKEDWSAVSEMFNDPPSSTEQILHPKKYYAERDNPMIVAFEKLEKIVGDDWKELLNNVHGEYGIRLVLAEFKAQSRRDNDRAAAGWDGDRFHCFERGDEVMTIWFTTWDNDEDAKQFFDAYAKLMSAKYEGAAKEEADQKVTFDATRQDAGRVLIERRGQDVLVVDGADGALLAKANALWNAAKKTELTKVERVKMEFCCPKHPEEQGAKARKCAVCGAEMTKKEERKDY